MRQVLGWGNRGTTYRPTTAFRFNAATDSGSPRFVTVCRHEKQLSHELRWPFVDKLTDSRSIQTNQRLELPWHHAKKELSMSRLHQIEPHTIRTILLAITVACSCSRTSHGQNVHLGTASVELQTALPQGVAGQTGGLVENKLVCVGGTSWSDDRQTKKWHDECLVKTEDRWVKGPPLPHPLSDAASAFNSSGLYLVGGTDRMTESRDVFCLSSVQGTWKSLAPLPMSIQGASAALIDGTLYVAGGKSEGRPQTRTWALEVSRQDATWRSLANFPVPAAPIVRLSPSIIRSSCWEVLPWTKREPCGSLTTPIVMI